MTNIKSYNLFTKIFILLLLNLTLIFTIDSIYAATNTVATQKYTIKSNVKTKKNSELGTHEFFYEPRSSIYEFWDEKEQYNIIYEIYNDNTKLAWVKLDKNMKKVSEVYMNRYLEMFGNAIYHNGYLYVVYGANDNTTTDATKSNFATAITIQITKYDTSGKVIANLPIKAKDTALTTSYTADVTSFATRYAFDAGNCDIAINKSNVMKCVFSKEMYNGHQMSSVVYVNINTMKHLNPTSTMDSSNKYFKLQNYYGGYYWVSHSFDQRIIATSDGNFLTVDRGDANPRSIYVSKTNENAQSVLAYSYETFHFRESINTPYGYNYTMANLGNIVEVSDGYILVANSEKTLSLNYANKFCGNESKNVFIQKFNKNFANKDEKTIQMLNTAERKSEAKRTDKKDQGEFRLNSNGVTDYGVKWLTNYTNRSVEDTRAIAIDNDRVAIIWAEVDFDSNGNSYISPNVSDIEYYYEIIDKNGNIVKGPHKIEGVKPTKLIDYSYKDGSIYWTQTENGNNTLVVHRLDLNLPFKDVNKESWYYSAVKYAYTNGIINGTNDTAFSPNQKLTRGMLVTILYNMENSPKVSGSMKFNDVAKGKYYYNAVLWASQNNVVNGINDTTFNPSANITRQDVAVILKNYANYKKKYVSSNYSLTKFSDYKNVSKYAQTAVKWAVENKVLNGSNGKLNPKGTATRAEATAMIYNYCNKIGR